MGTTVYMGFHLFVFNIPQDRLKRAILGAQESAKIAPESYLGLSMDSQNANRQTSGILGHPKFTTKIGPRELQESPRVFHHLNT